MASKINPRRNSLAQIPYSLPISAPSALMKKRSMRYSTSYSQVEQAPPSEGKFNEILCSYVFTLQGEIDDMSNKLLSNEDLIQKTIKEKESLAELLSNLELELRIPTRIKKNICCSKVN